METYNYEEMNRSELATVIRKFRRCNIEVPKELREAYNKQQREQRNNKITHYRNLETTRRRKSRAKSYAEKLKETLMKLEQYDIGKLREMYTFIGGLLQKHDNPPEDFTEMYTDPDVGKPSPLSWDNPMEWERIKRSEEYIGICGATGWTYRTFADFTPWAALIKDWGYKNVKKAIELMPALDIKPMKVRAFLQERLKQKRMQQEKENDLRSLEDNAKG